MVIDGKAIAEKIYIELRALPVPSQALAAVLVGDAPDSKAFIEQKTKAAKALGVRFERMVLRGDISEEELLSQLTRLSNDNNIGGVILQLPLPKHVDTEKVLPAIDCRKDVDVLNTEKKCLDILPPTVGALARILEELRFELSGKQVAVIGQGRLVGQPICGFLHDKVGKLDLFDKDSFDAAALKSADLIVTGAGKPGLLIPEMLKSDALVIDFGFSLENGKPYGDFLTPEEPSDIRYTPTPGGTGPLVVAQLFANFYAITK